MVGVVVIGVGAVVALGYTTRVAIDVYRAGLTLTGLSPDPSPVTLTIAVPRNMLRDGATIGSDKPVQQAELVLHWPGLDGYSPSLAADFKDGSPSAPLVYATVAERTVTVDSGTRLDSIYARYFVGDPVAAPAGLTARALSADSGYGGEVVYYGPAGGQRFVARCVARATADTPATCIRDLPAGHNLTLLYRFNRDIIGDWQAFDTGMRALAAQLAAPQ